MLLLSPPKSLLICDTLLGVFTILPLPSNLAKLSSVKVPLELVSTLGC